MSYLLSGNNVNFNQKQVVLFLFCYYVFLFPQSVKTKNQIKLKFRNKNNLFFFVLNQMKNMLIDEKLKTRFVLNIFFQF